MIEEVDRQSDTTPLELLYGGNDIRKSIDDGKASLRLLESLYKGSDRISYYYDNILKDEMVIIKTDRYQYSYWKKGFNKENELDLSRIPIVDGQLGDLGDRLILCMNEDKYFGNISFVEGIGIKVWNKNSHMHKDDTTSATSARKFINLLRNDAKQERFNNVRDSVYIMLWSLILNVLRNLDSKENSKHNI